MLCTDCLSEKVSSKCVENLPKTTDFQSKNLYDLVSEIDTKIKSISPTNIKLEKKLTDITSEDNQTTINQKVIDELSSIKKRLNDLDNIYSTKTSINLTGLTQELSLIEILIDLIERVKTLESNG